MAFHERDQEFLNSSEFRELRRRMDRSYNDMRRLILLAAVFFLIGILVIMSRLQVAAEDIFRWTPVIWLLGVVVAGTMMNLFLQCARFWSKKRKTEQRERRLSITSSRLSSLLGNFPDSFPCLAPSPHIGCCRDPSRRLHRDFMESKESLPAYRDIVELEEDNPPPDYHEAIGNRCSNPMRSIFPLRRTLPLSSCPVHGKLPPKHISIERRVREDGGVSRMEDTIDETCTTHPDRSFSPNQENLS